MNHIGQRKFQAYCTTDHWNSISYGNTKMPCYLMSCQNWKIFSSHVCKLESNLSSKLAHWLTFKTLQTENVLWNVFHFFNFNVKFNWNNLNFRYLFRCVWTEEGVWNSAYNWNCLLSHSEMFAARKTHLGLCFKSLL